MNEYKHEVAPSDCDYQPYKEIDGSLTYCTRGRNHAGGCYWPPLPEWRRRAMQARRNAGFVAVKEL